MKTVILNALELGCIYSLAALALLLSYRILNIADMTTDGSFTLGCAVCAVLSVAGHPYIAIPAAMAAGACAGIVTALLQTRCGVMPILAGIITNTGLYTVNLAVMGFSSNVSMMRAPTIFTPFPSLRLVPAALIALLAAVLLVLFLRTRLGLSIRATGDNPEMVRASSVNTAVTITVGLAVANALTALSGALLAQYQKTADINLGTGMVVIALASLVIGQTVVRSRKLHMQALGAIAGSIIYRLIIAAALRLDLPSECLKLASAVIVAAAIALPNVRVKRREKRIC